MRNKVRHYGVGDEVKNVMSSGSVSGESESEEEKEGDVEEEKRCEEMELEALKKGGGDPDALVEVKEDKEDVFSAEGN